MNRWEYKTFQIYSASNNVFTFDGDNLSELGMQGWELVAVQEVSGGAMAFFKRPVAEPAPDDQAG